MKRIIITGEIQSGKTTLAAALVDSLRMKGRSVAGFLALGIWDDDQRSGFDLLDLTTNAVTPLARRAMTEQAGEITPFIFNEAGLAAGRGLLSPESAGKSEYIFIDEVGKLEMKGAGWAPELSPLLEAVSQEDALPERTLIWLVRATLVEAVMRRWDVPRTDIVSADSDDALEQLQSLCFAG